MCGAPIRRRNCAATSGIGSLASRAWHTSSVTHVPTSEVVPRVIPDRNDWVDSVRGVAITLVVLGHVVQFGSGNQLDHFENPLFVVIYSFHMPLFAFISGYLAFGSFSRREPLAVLRSKVSTIAIPYIAWTVLIGGSLVLARQIAGSGIDPLALVASIGKMFLYPGETLWFLWFLLLAYLLISVAISAGKTLREFAIPISVAIVFLIPLNQELEVFELRWLYPFFVLGYYVYRFKSNIAKWSLALTIFSLAVFVVLIMFWQRDDSVYISQVLPEPGGITDTALSWTYRYAVAFFGTAAAVGLIRLVSRRVSNSAIEALGRASMGIYCIQNYLIAIVAMSPSPLVSAPALFWSYIFGLTVLILVIAFVTTRRLLERFSILNRVFLGGRAPLIREDQTSARTAQSPLI